MDFHDQQWMRHAVAAAERGPSVDPNPRVGCVLVSDAGALIATGWHHGAGTPHAEIDALRQAGTAARGATAYVTLEPCHHTGRTGPCTRALDEAGVRRVVVAVRDPNPIASGGAAWLADHGVEITAGILADEATALNRTWLHRQRSGRPWVTWKFAATLDGRAAAADGTSQWITGAQARADVHRLRAECGAILVGTGTVLTDNPQLTVRDQDGTPLPTQPIRVVMGLRPVPADSRVNDDVAPTLLIHSRDPAEVLHQLAADGIHHVWLEGGPTLAAAFLRDGMVDEVVGYVAPALLGAGPSALGDLGIGTIGDALRLTPVDVTRIGDDIRLIAHVQHPSPPQPPTPRGAL